MPFLALLGLDDGLTFSGHGGIGFQEVWNGQHGFQLYTKPNNENHVYVSVNLPGRCLEQIGLDKLVPAHEWLCERAFNGLKWGVTRCDLAFDTQKFGVQQFADAYHAGEVETASRTWNEHKGSDGGHTFYVGSRESLALLWVYHKTDGCSFGDDAFTRVELELKKERAFFAYLSIMASDPSKWAEMAGRLLSGFVKVNTSWWTDFTGAVAASWLKLRRKLPTVARIEKWLRRQVAPSFATYVQALSQGDADVLAETVNELLKVGQEGLTSKHRALINAADPGSIPEFAVYSW